MFKLLEKVKYMHDDENIYIDFSQGWRKKITSRIFPILLGKNGFNSIAQGILATFNLLEKDEGIDPYYTIRGEVVEYFGKKWLENELKIIGLSDDEIEIKAYKQSDFKGYDMFVYDEALNTPKMYKFFGGVADIEIFKPFKATVEVKSKDILRFENYNKNKNADRDTKDYQYTFSNEEIIQGKILAMLSGNNNLIMLYGFPKFYVEKAIKEDFMKNKEIYENDVIKFVKTKNYTFEDFEFIKQKHVVDEEELKKQMNETVILLNKCSSENFIPKEYFSDKEWNVLTFNKEELPF